MSTTATTILGLDPGTATTGFGIILYENNNLLVHDVGTITTPKSIPDAERLAAIRNDVERLIQTYRPSIVAIEKLFFTKNVKTAIAVAQARGVLLECVGAYAISVTEFTPNEIKLALTGYGNASKRQVQYMVQQILGLDSAPQPDDAADALAVAICCAHTQDL